MKDNIDHLEKYRIENPPFWNDIGPNDIAGRYIIPARGPLKTRLIVVFTAGEQSDWEHASVSVHKKQRCPTWEEMCFVKKLFWNEDEVCIQYHPAKKDYRNAHPYCLHIWRHKSVGFVVPDPLLVAPKVFSK